MIETDLLFAFVKKSDWLKGVATKFMDKVSKGELKTVHASRESLHELYYVSREEGITIDEIIERISSLTAINNLEFLETTSEIDILALTLIKQYNLRSVFDAYHGATALNQVADHTIVSTDEVFSDIPGIVRVDPRQLV